MSKQFKEKTELPRFIIVIFFVQFIFFIFYTMSNREDKSLIYFSISILLMGIFLAFVRLIVVINEEGINYKLFPLINKKIDWNEINNIQIVKISALSSFLGWGIRFSKNYGWSFITNSEYGLLIKKTDGKRVTLSIKNRKELILFLESNNLKKLMVL